MSEIMKPCEDEAELSAWLTRHLGICVPRSAVCAGHSAPMEYLRRVYFEPASDVVVWAPRGGGKTRLGAAATLLDLLHKPGVAVRILGGSLEQSLRMWEHLVPDLEALLGEDVAGKRGTARRVKLPNGSSAAVLTQSQRAVRGQRVQKMRCDEVELFDPAVWTAVQLTTRSSRGAGGTIEALSTLHTPYGLMSQVVESAGAAGTPVVRWCVMEVLERCPPERECASCPLWTDCLGRAKTQCDGFVSIDDAIAMKRRVSLETWQAEMLCTRPATNGCVFGGFDEATHVTDDEPAGGVCELGVDFGYSAPFVALWVVRDESGGATVIDEYVRRGRTVAEHAAEVWRRGRDVAWVGCDPAGNAASDQTGVTSAEVLRKAGFHVRTQGQRIAEGVEGLRAMLSPADGSRPTLRIHRRCRELIKAMKRYRYRDARTDAILKDGEHDHPVDALRYWWANRVMAAVATREY